MRSLRHIWFQCFPFALVLLTYHSLSGVKHLIMDMGVGETMAGGVLGARIVICVAAVGALGWGVVLW